MTVTRPSYEMIEEQDNCFQYREHDAFSDLIRWHYHEEYELHLLVSSRGKSFVGDYVGTFQPGCLILTGPNLPHNWISLSDISTGVRDRVINFTHEFMLSLMALVPEARSMRRMLADARYGIQFTPHISECVEPWFQTLSEQQGLQRFNAFLQIMERLSASGAYTRLSTRQYDDAHDTQTLDRINRVVNYMTEHFTDTCSLEDVAAQIQLSPEVFSRFFHRATGHRFKDFLTRLRVGKACEYLESTDWPVTNICYEVGFRNLSNFNRRFLDVKGMTPTEYRRNIAQRDRRATSHILL
ncbi:AraC family transcriptional regulator [Natronospirillum operosum]|uniref:AraC family transcriptional regulator n=1 Tax=Natronospirillum operosum TaxID=2759953 RepID=A0A4Z0W9E7_9GAMM|nr:AraC family transcriptional regulator [Natronospirillum operosum]TGG94237.1 AraC family transcriptional regulator [Natronospirillum operosum]